MVYLNKTFLTNNIVAKNQTNTRRTLYSKLLFIHSHVLNIFLFLLFAVVSCLEILDIFSAWSILNFINQEKGKYNQIYTISSL